MPRLTPEQLREARSKKERERAAEAERLAQEETARMEAYEARAERLSAMKARHGQLESVVNALYEEVDKLSRKWPISPVSKLTLDKTNKAIRAAHELLQEEGDDFADDINEFVPAGDPPENRDVTLTLGELKAALARFADKYRSQWGY